MHAPLALLAAASAAAAVLPAAPAAAASFAAAQPTCAQKISAVADGTVYGAGDCGGGVSVLVRSPGGAWRNIGVAWPNKRVEAVAADEVATFIVMSCTSADRGCQTADPLGEEFFIGKVLHGGRPSALTPLGGTELSGDLATVAARGGRWWAAFTQTIRDRDVEGSGSRKIIFRKTFGGAGRGEVTAPQDASGTRVYTYDPAITLTGTGALLAFLTQTAGSGEPAALNTGTAGPDGIFRSEPFAPAAGAPAAAPDVAFSGGRTFLAWSRDGRPALAFERDGSMSRIDLPFRGTVTFAGPTVAASGGRVTVTTAERFPYRGKHTTRVYARALDAHGTLRSTTELTAAAGRQDPYVEGGLSDSTAARGRATVAYSVGSTRLSASQD